MHIFSQKRSKLYKVYNTQNFLPNPTMKNERKDTINVKIYRTAIDFIEKYKKIFAYFFYTLYIFNLLDRLQPV